MPRALFNQLWYHKIKIQILDSKKYFQFFFYLKTSQNHHRNLNNIIFNSKTLELVQNQTESKQNSQTPIYLFRHVWRWNRLHRTLLSKNNSLRPSLIFLSSAKYFLSFLPFPSSFSLIPQYSRIETKTKQKNTLKLL